MSGTNTANIPSPEQHGDVQVYRGRIAPTPSGHLHVGHAQTFWIAQKRARSHGGVIFLRIEDIDAVRCKPHFLNDLMEDLRWFGINLWDERLLYGDTEQAAGAVPSGMVHPIYKRLHLSMQAIATRCRSASEHSERVFPASLRPSYIQQQQQQQQQQPSSSNLFPPEFQNMVSPLHYSNGSKAPALYGGHPLRGLPTLAIGWFPGI
eukprot:gene26054-34655_t